MRKTFVALNVIDTPGKLGEVSQALAHAGINIEGFMVDRGSIRFLTNDHARAVTALQTAGYSPSATDVFEVDLPNQPGELARLGQALGKVGVNILSSFGVTSGPRGRVFLKVSDEAKARPVIEALGRPPAAAAKAATGAVHGA